MFKQHNSIKTTKKKPMYHKMQNLNLTPSIYIPSRFSDQQKIN